MQRENITSRSFAFGRSFITILGIGLVMVGLGSASRQSAKGQSGGVYSIPIPSSGIGPASGPALSITNTGTGDGGYFLINQYPTKSSALAAYNTAMAYGAHLAGPEAAVYGASGNREGHLADGNYAVYGTDGQNTAWIGGPGTGLYAEGTSYGVHGSCGYGSAIEGETTYGTAVRGFSYTSLGLAGDFVGLLRTSGFQLSTAPQAGYVLTSDANGNGTWQPVSSNSVTAGVQSLNSLTGSVQIVAGNGISITKHGNQIIISSTSSTANRISISVAVGGTYYIPAGYAYVDLVGGVGLATVLLPPASAVPSGTTMIVSVSTRTNGASMKIDIVDQNNQTVANMSSDGSYGPPTVTFTSNGSNWSH